MAAGSPTYKIHAIGRVSSQLRDPGAAPRQGDEGGPEAHLEFEPEVLEALRDIHQGDQLLVLTWLDRADREVLVVHPRGDRSRPPTGVFSTRSPHRPNPIGLHRVQVLSVDGPRVEVRGMETIDGTPIVDVKPVLSAEISER